MPGSNGIGLFIIIMGVVVIGFGLLMLLVGRVPRAGRLPGEGIS